MLRRFRWLIRFLPVFAVALALWGPAHAWGGSVLLDEMTWVEVRDALRAGSTTILIPVGGTEQNGPHMALGKHNFRAAALAPRIATAAGKTLVAPVLAYVPEGRVNPPAGHMRFPGTISVPQDAFEAILAGAARSLKQHGFRDIVFVGDSGNYQDSLRNVAQRLDREWAGSGAHAHHLAAYYQAASSAYAQALRARGITDAQIGVHAGLSDTALMLAVDPTRVRPDLMRSPPGPEPASGVVGDPTAATEALGRVGVDLIVERSVQALHQALVNRR